MAVVTQMAVLSLGMVPIERLTIVPQERSTDEHGALNNGRPESGYDTNYDVPGSTVKLPNYSPSASAGNGKQHKPFSQAGVCDGDTSCRRRKSLTECVGEHPCRWSSGACLGEIADCAAMNSEDACDSMLGGCTWKPG